jgi:hypothetical protein
MNPGSISLTSLLIFLFTSEKMRKSVENEMESAISTFIPVRDPESLIPDSATPDERDFVLQHKHILEVSSSDVVMNAQSKALTKLINASVLIRILMFMVAIFVLLIVLPLILYVMFNVLLNKQDILRVVLLAFFAIGVSIIGWVVVFKE